MTTTPPTWMTCDHRGIGLPGCPTCDGRLDPETRRMLTEARDYAVHRGTELLLAHKQCLDYRAERDQLRASMDSPIGIGPWTRVGGEPPEPWPGMGVKVRCRNGWAMYLCEPVCVDGVVYALTIGTDVAPRLDVNWRLDEVLEVWRDHICIWKRE